MNAPTRVARYTAVWDFTGITLSALCLIHCLSLPLIILFLPPLGLTLTTTSEDVHTVLAIIVPITSIFAFVPGYRRHRNARVLYAAACGAGAIVAAAFLLPETINKAAEISATTLGSALLIGAHWRNHAFCRHCPICKPANPRLMP
jgi:hypothetical protein